MIQKQENCHGVGAISWLSNKMPTTAASCWSVDCNGQENALFAGLLESANWSILAPRRLIKEVVGKKSGFYVN